MQNSIETATIDLVKVVGKFFLFAVLASVLAFGLVLLSLLFLDKDLLLASLNASLRADNILYITCYYTCMAIGIMIAIVILYRHLEHKSLSAIGLDVKHFPKQFAIGSLWGIVLIGAVFTILLATGLVRVTTITFSARMLFHFALFFLMVSLVEELVFRTFTINLVRDTYGPFVALIVSAILFSIVHYDNSNFGGIPFFSILLGGIILGLLYLKSNQLWYPLGFHFTWNFFQGTVFGFQVSGSEMPSLLQLEKTNAPLWTGGDFGIEGSLLGILALGLCILFYRKDLVKIFRQPKIEIPNLDTLLAEEDNRIA